MPSSRRARQVLDALASVSDEALLGTGLDGPAAEWLRDLVRAREAADPEAAITDVMDRHAQAGLDDLGGLISQLTGQLEGLPPVPDPGDVLPDLDRARAALDSLPKSQQDPAVDSILAEARALLGATGPLQQALDSAPALQGIQRAIHDAARALSQDPQAPLDVVAIQSAITRLQRKRDHLRGVQHDLNQVGSLLERMDGLASEAGHPAQAAALAASRVELLQALDAPPATIRSARHHAFDQAIRAQLLPQAQRLGRQLQLDALRHDQLQPVVDVCDRIERLAFNKGDTTAQVAALCEAALTLAQLPGGANQARARIAQARVIANKSDRPAVRAQAHLAEGQLLVKLGDLAGARHLFRQLMRQARHDPSFPYELGWAALELGRLERRAGQLSRAGQDLALASSIGAKAKDWLLYGLATRERFDLAEQGTDPALARRIVDELAQTGVAIGGDAARDLLATLRGRQAS